MQGFVMDMKQANTAALPALLPPPLKQGDLIAIVSPASKIDAALIDAAARQLTDEGFRVEVSPHAKGVFGSYSGTAEERLSDLKRAIEKPDVKAILCSRGGYGAVHLLEGLAELPAPLFRKWLIGFSDITALHCLWNMKGVASMHAAMAKYIGRGKDFEMYTRELAMLTTSPSSPQRREVFSFSFPWHSLNNRGRFAGRIVGGNLAVLGGLIGTPFFPDLDGAILFLEDVAEPIYKVERILWQLRLAGAFEKISGLLVGQFTEYRPSADHPDMYEMIESFMDGYAFPRAYDIPAGHIEANIPLLFGVSASVEVEPHGVGLRYDF